ncbi:MAG: hypothetical protein EZS28_019915 [Streblomastix strix]|uniref:Uncharacterized protein n=1 Tax=Streblomastix strix TaxID=222440 RepID=A0A5J4VPI1_9EUKA|nr:MAG: hypothetical protein EZS28_019915 [Streblomastix strix]
MKCCSVSNPFDSFSSVISYIEKERPNSDGSSVMTLSQTDSDTINIVGCGMNETEMCVGLRFKLRIFLVVMNDYNVSNLGVDLNKAYFNGNEAYQQYLRRYQTPPILLGIRIADEVIEGREIYGCVLSDDPCWTFEFGLQKVSLGIGGNETELIENKTIMISDETDGYDQDQLIELIRKQIPEYENKESIIWR